MKWSFDSLGNLGANKDRLLGAMLASSGTSCELASEELGSRGIGLARAFDEEAAMSSLNWEEKKFNKRMEKNSHTPVEL